MSLDAAWLSQLLAETDDVHPSGRAPDGHCGEYDCSDYHASDGHFCDGWECDWSRGLRGVSDKTRWTIAALIRVYQKTQSAHEGETSG